jgi:hypothetical protein
MDRIAIQDNGKILVLKGTINNRRAFLSLAFFCPTRLLPAIYRHRPAKKAR